MMPVRGHPTCGTITFGQPSSSLYARRRPGRSASRRCPCRLTSNPSASNRGLPPRHSVVCGESSTETRSSAPDSLPRRFRSWSTRSASPGCVRNPVGRSTSAGSSSSVEQEAAERDSERLLAQEQRRRVAAEDAAIRTRAELVALTERLGEREIELQSARRRESAGESGARSPATVGRRAQAGGPPRPRPGGGSASSARACGNRTRRRDPASRRRRVAARRVAGRAGRAAGRVTAARPRSLGCANSPRWPVPSGTNWRRWSPPDRARRQPVEVPRPAAKDPRVTSRVPAQSARDRRRRRRLQRRQAGLAGSVVGVAADQDCWTPSTGWLGASARNSSS